MAHAPENPKTLYGKPLPYGGPQYGYPRTADEILTELTDETPIDFDTEQLEQEAQELDFHNVITLTNELTNLAVKYAKASEDKTWAEAKLAAAKTSYEEGKNRVLAEQYRAQYQASEANGQPARRALTENALKTLVALKCEPLQAQVSQAQHAYNAASGKVSELSTRISIYKSLLTAELAILKTTEGIYGQGRAAMNAHYRASKKK